MKLAILATLVVVGVFGFGLEVSTINIDINANAETPCSPPVAMEDDRFLVERCSDGSWVTDTQDGSRTWVSSSGGVDKICSEAENGMDVCVRTPTE